VSHFHRERLVNLIRIALANLRYPATPDESITLAAEAVARASSSGARIICFPECFVPGYRGIDISAATGLMAARCRTVP
jgi:predicted amidohydrolase